MDVSSLADTVATVLRLCVHGGVPVAVIEYDCVGPGQVHPDASAASRQNEAEDSAICVEALHEGLSLLHTSAAIQAEVDVSVVVEELLQHI